MTRPRWIDHYPGPRVRRRKTGGLMWWTGLVVAAFCLWGFAVTVGAFLAVLMTEAVAR